MPGGTLVKTGAPGLEWLPLAAERRVLEIQTRCTDGRLVILITGSMICSTLSPILRS